jgi:hypothetical protein
MDVAPRMAGHGGTAVRRLFYMHCHRIVNELQRPSIWNCCLLPTVPLRKLSRTLWTRYSKDIGLFFVKHICSIHSYRRESWFNQPDVDALADAGINTVRIPVSGMTLVVFFSCHLARLLDH